ncbi:MAG: phage tail protein [Pseudomonadota bacterium]
MMATLVLSAVGSAVAGPLGSAVGGLIGRQVDQAIFGSGGVEGPRLTELAVTTSSYGQAIPRRFGRIRASGTIIWSTDLIESSETEGGKGQPSTTNYSYSVSFAVAVSSTPIESIGRVWGDGELLIGANGDLKVGGSFRTHLGLGNAMTDPLIEAAENGGSTAFRDYAYIVFEDLQLAEFGNRIPALTFEIFSPNNSTVSLQSLAPFNVAGQKTTTLANTKGFSDEGGPISSSLTALERIYPIQSVVEDGGIAIWVQDEASDSFYTLPESLTPTVSSQNTKRNHQLMGTPEREPLALRYYDEDLDYQPGVQRASGRRAGGSEVMIDLPATMNAQGAKDLINAKAIRSRWAQDQITWSTAELNPAIMPGTRVTVPDKQGDWEVASWEWNEGGVEYSLKRIGPKLTTANGAQSGQANIAEDIQITPTILTVVEVPPYGTQNASLPEVYAAVTSETSAWKGAALFLEQPDGMIAISPANSRRATAGQLVGSLESSASLLFEPNASIEVQLPSADLGFKDTTIDGLALGSSRLLVGSEVIQFLEAEPIDNNQWRLTGLMRGRGGTEDFAQEGHTPGTQITLLDETLNSLDPTVLQQTEVTRVAAIGVGDSEAVIASVQNRGLSLRPPSPVHPKVSIVSDGAIEACWTRRARGAWKWEDLVDAPLVEEKESYLVGFGPVLSPFAVWTSHNPVFTLEAAERSQLVTDHGTGQLWVKQVGTHSISPALLLTELD